MLGLFESRTYAEDINEFEIEMLLERLDKEDTVKAKKLRRILNEKYEDWTPYIEELEEIVENL